MVLKFLENEQVIGRAQLMMISLPLERREVVFQQTMIMGDHVMVWVMYHVALMWLNTLVCLFFWRVKATVHPNLLCSGNNSPSLIICLPGRLGEMLTFFRRVYFTTCSLRSIHRLKKSMEN